MTSPYFSGAFGTFLSLINLLIIETEQSIKSSINSFVYSSENKYNFYSKKETNSSANST